MDISTVEELEALSSLNKRMLLMIEELYKIMALMQDKLDLQCSILKDTLHQLNTVPCSEIGYKDLRKMDPKELQYCKRIVGEIAFQLDRRILSFIFLEDRELYGITVSNAQEKILQTTVCQLTNKVDEVRRSELKSRYIEIMDYLKRHGYDPHLHPIFSEYLVNSYGMMNDQTEPEDTEIYNDPEVLRKMAAYAMPEDALKNVYILIDCLVDMAELDGKPIFIWYR